MLRVLSGCGEPLAVSAEEPLYCGSEPWTTGFVGRDKESEDEEYESEQRGAGGHCVAGNR